VVYECHIFLGILENINQHCLNKNWVFASSTLSALICPARFHDNSGKTKVLTKIQWKQDQTTCFASRCSDKCEFGNQLWITDIFLEQIGLLFAYIYCFRLRKQKEVIYGNWDFSYSTEPCFKAFTCIDFSSF